MPIYDLEKKAEREFRAIRRSKILHEGNRELLLEYERELKLNEIFAGRIHKLLTHLKVMIEELSERTFDDTGLQEMPYGLPTLPEIKFIRTLDPNI